jgi:uncharacterized protein (DUF169 family)
MVNLKQIDEALTHYIRPQTFPLAIRLCGPAEELPGKTRTPKKDAGIDISLCHAVNMARRYGWALAVDKSQSCYVAGISMGFLPLLPDVIDGSFQESLGLWGMTRKQAAAAIENLPKFECGKYKNVLMAPLNKANFEPHIVVVYGNPAQIWTLLAGYLNGTGKTGLDTTLALGAGCANYITRTVKEDECQFTLLSLGERLIPHTEDCECAFSIPTSKIEKTIQGLELGHKIGVLRYPIPSFLNYNSPHPPGYEKMRSHLLGEKP